MLKTLANERDTAEILRRVRALRPDSARRWGRMSVHQMVCHLCDGYRLVIGERTSQPVAVPVPRAVMKCIALYVPLRWPPGIRTMPEFDQEIGGTRPAHFDTDVAELTRLIEHIGSAPRGRFGGTIHPIFGAMSESAWLRWAYLHADHHLRQFGV